MSSAIIPQSPTEIVPAGDLAFDTSLLAGQLAPASIAKYAQDVRAYLAFADTQPPRSTLPHWPAGALCWPLRRRFRPTRSIGCSRPSSAS